MFSSLTSQENLKHNTKLRVLCVEPSISKKTSITFPTFPYNTTLSVTSLYSTTTLTEGPFTTSVTRYFTRYHLACKPEVQPLAPLIFRSLQIMLPLLWSPRIPDLVSASVHKVIVKVHCEIEKDVANSDSDQVFVSAAVARSIVYFASILLTGGKVS